MFGSSSVDQPNRGVRFFGENVPIYRNGYIQPMSPEPFRNEPMFSFPKKPGTWFSQTLQDEKVDDLQVVNLIIDVVKTGCLKSRTYVTLLPYSMEELNVHTELILKALHKQLGFPPPETSLTVKPFADTGCIVEIKW